MSLFDAVFGVVTPRDRKRLLAICEKRIACGENQKAISLAFKYIKRGVKTTSLTQKQKEQKDLDMGSCYYIIGKALFNIFKFNPSYRKYDYFKLFFHAHIISSGIFQDYTKNSEYYSYFQQLDFFIDEIYKIYSDNPEIEGAERDAFDENTAACNAVLLKSMGLE